MEDDESWSLINWLKWKGNIDIIIRLGFVVEVLKYIKDLVYLLNCMFFGLWNLEKLIKYY